MLILTRRIGEGISIGPDIEISVLEVSGDHVRIGIEAPRDVQVLRSELRFEVVTENRLALRGVRKRNIGSGSTLKLAAIPQRAPITSKAAEDNAST